MQNKSLDRLYVGNRSAGLTRAYIQFAAMPTIPAGATITAATMTLHFTSGTNTAANASAYQVTGGEWASGTIQWSNKPAADAFFKAGVDGEGVGKANGGTDASHIQKVMYIPQAMNETIYSPQIHYEYDTADVWTITHNIQEQYS